MNISRVHHNVTKDLTLSVEERGHPTWPHLVVSTIKVWRT
jgi:hypothetical protein